MKLKIYLKDIRKKKGMTTEQLADKSGVSKSQINYIEREVVYPTIFVMCKLAQALNVSVCELFSYDSN